MSEERGGAECQGLRTVLLDKVMSENFVLRTGEVLVLKL